ncbi:phosphoglycerate dehydrogenase [Peptoniphilus sp. MSJ-1]|uniref:D-3-phosphoglycerate dehydrogenase n=1 Tax=Peptoniphilus ovalis TaxID=2841503 RepID=A0ABS6FEN8_9FIRM|nr:phosphoglycerate dehydrogenase [Peptoniphilus ovalis]MBU5668646.1 phosphoglycerate dehydrogenase [Peptoniphilus ovalis]
MKRNYKIKTINNISKKGLNLLPENFNYNAEEENPDAILVRSADLHDMDFPENVRYIGRAGAGTNNIPVNRCAEMGIVVCNAPGANANAVKELALTGMLLASRDIIGAANWANNLECHDNIKKDVEAGKKAFAGPELKGKTLGVIGLGATGQLVASAGVDMGMKVIGYDPFLSIKNALHLDNKVGYTEDIKEIFKNADYISLHIPYSEATKNIVNGELFEIAKDGLVLLNIARGGLVDIEALEKYLENGKVKKYVCDFPDEETINLKNTINLPHIGASTPESEENSAKMVVEELVDFLENGNIKNSVNFPNMDMGKCNSAHRILVLHQNIPSMIAQITTILADEKVNISDLLNRHKDKWAATMIDIDSEVDENLRTKLYGIEGVVRVRLIK